MFIDSAKIFVEAGRGGSGCVSFLRDKLNSKGGPDGGNGGNGGDIVLEVHDDLRTLLDFQRRKHFRADRGQHGKGSNQTGRSGKNMIIRIPPGTIIYDFDTSNVLTDLVNKDERFVIAHGGKGGKGNARYVSSTNRAPREWEPGGIGQSYWIKLELKLLADVGLVGLPNAGKSTLLSRISAAQPKIADYPFTTLTPNLGVVSYREYHSFVVADIPGLIEGAHTGRGLGIEFLRHIERTKVLVILIDTMSEDIQKDYEALITELQSYDTALLEKPRIIALTKNDLRIDNELGQSFIKNCNYPICKISSVTGAGLNELLDMMWNAVHL